MKKLFGTLSFFLLAFSLFAQPANDDCNGIIDLGVAPYCPDTVFFTNENATATDIGNDNVPGVNGCMGLGPMQHDVWFQFIASDTILDYTIEVTGITDGMGSTAMIMPQVAIYRGDCEFDGLQLLDCNAADLNESSVQLNVSGLTPGLPYFLRITDYSESATPNWGTFKLCVRPKDPVIIIDDDVVTDLCIGEVYDSGGPDGDYSANENYTLTIQPPAPTGCINFTFEYYNIDEFGEQIVFYDGPSTSSPVIATITGQNFSSGGGGAVCYQVSASSGALTMQFISDGSVELDGFHGYWECSSEPCEPYALIQTEETQDTTTIVDALTSPQTQLTITNINCPNGAMGVFSQGDLTDLGLEKGLLLTSGSVTGVSNPGSFFTSQNNMAPGDADLDFLSNLPGGNGQPSFDACILELDVFVATDELNFEYVFGSEEYPEYVNTSFNDIFAFLISGPGITGIPGLNGQDNIAVLPPPINVPVEINSVNNLQNWEYYRNNLEGPSVAYDGLTSDYLGVKKSLTAHANVIPCNTYHLKLAVADRGDGVFDSGVFISDIRGSHPVASIDSQNGVDYLAEECTLVPDFVIFQLNEPAQDTLTYEVQITGTATPDLDYTTTVPNEITFLPGQTTQTFQIAVLSDGITEGEEYVTFSLVKDFGCGEVVLDSVSIQIFDELQVEILQGVDTAYVCEGGSLNISATGAASYFWTPISVFDNPGIPNPVVTPPQSMFVYVTGTVGPCVDMDSVWLEMLNPTLSIGTQDPTGICQGDTVFLFAGNNVGNSNLNWTPLDGIVSDPTQPGVFVAPQQTTTYSASVEIEGCSASDEITIFVDTFDPGMLTTSDTTICQGYPVQLAAPISPDTSTTTYLWLPPLYLDNPNIAGATAMPETDITYTLFSVSQNAYCADTASISIEVIPADVTIIQPEEDYLEICLGDSVQINTTTTHSGIMWTPSDWLSDPASENPLATPEESVTYVASLQVGECIVYDSLHIRVDSLPELTIMADSLKDPYCAGEQVILFSDTYDPVNFPDIVHQWQPDNAGLLTSDTLFNLVLLLSDTITMTRYTSNHACSDSASITLNVIPTTALEVTPTDTTICPGSSVQLEATSPIEVTEWTWEPALGLSCTDCPNPVATPPTTTQYSVSADIQGCASQGPPVLITLYPQPQYQFADPAAICAGESIELNQITDPNATYSWSVDGNEFSTEPQPVVSPAETTTYTLLIQYLDCEPIEDQITVEVVQEPQLTISEDQKICLGQSVTLTADGVVSGSYSWQPGNENTASIQVTPSQSGWYVVTFEDAAGCFVTTDSVFVDVGEGFFVSEITAEPDTVFEGDPLLLNVLTDPATLLDPAYAWFFSGVEPLGDNAAQISVIAPGIEDDDTEAVSVYYQVVVTDGYGCTDTASVNVLVYNSLYAIPQLFTPNDDKHNDTFKIYHTEGGVEVLTLNIYNRWGQLVYGNEDGKAEWDGTQNGQPAPSDVYVYYAEIRLGDGRIVVEKGDITLLR